MIFVISNFLAFIVPDIPDSVQREIKKEKLLAYEAIQSRLAGGKSPKPTDTVTEGDDL